MANGLATVRRLKYCRYVQCPSATQKAAFINAINKGIITWQAEPMNLEVEMAADPWLFEFGLDLGTQLDKRFNITRKYRVLSLRDVPGGCGKPSFFTLNTIL